jgi:hypothetical protein
MGLSAPTIQRYVLSPLLYIWIAVSIVMSALVVADCCLPPELAPIKRFADFRQNLVSPEWKAAEAAARKVPSDCVVVVDTDDPDFLYLLRYKLYPTWVVDRSDLPAWDGASPAITLCSVGYRNGVVTVSGGEAD